MVPSGGRVYYLNRSQPPLLASMVNIYYAATKDTQFVKESLPHLEQEYTFWLKKRNVTIIKNGKSYLMARYNVDTTHPRSDSTSF